jgi:hypothetical protein
MQPFRVQLWTQAPAKVSAPLVPMAIRFVQAVQQEQHQELQMVVVLRLRCACH